MIPSQLKYSQEHEWALIEGNIATIGITDYAVDELGDIVFVELAEVGSELDQMDEFGSIESVKTLSSLFAPLAGEIIEINNDVVQSPGTINESPYDQGWLVKIRITDEKEISSLMDATAYEEFLDNQ